MFQEKTETVEFISKHENIVVKRNSRNLEAFNNSHNQLLPNWSFEINIGKANV